VTSLSVIQLIQKEIIDICKANPPDYEEAESLKHTVQSTDLLSLGLMYDKNSQASVK